MSNRQIKTDNSRLNIKIKMRLDKTNDGDIVLDCFHGKGVIWDIIKKHKNIEVYGIEKEKNKGRIALYGECEKVIPSLDLSCYNIIDCDAWGIPYKAIKAVLKNHTLKKGTVIFYTFIQAGMGIINKELLQYTGVKKL